MDMQPIESSLQEKEAVFGQVRDFLEPEGFSLANWDYQQGYLDCQLDDKATVFLRLPIFVEEGMLDDTDALIKFGQPFVLRHVVQTGIDPDIGYATGPQVAAMFNQFQEPQNKDASVDSQWVARAEQLLRRVEPLIP